MHILYASCRFSKFSNSQETRIHSFVNACLCKISAILIRFLYINKTYIKCKLSKFFFVISRLCNLCIIRWLIVNDLTWRKISTIGWHNGRPLLKGIQSVDDAESLDNRDVGHLKAVYSKDINFRAMVRVGCCCFRRKIHRRKNRKYKLHLDYYKSWWTDTICNSRAATLPNYYSFNATLTFRPQSEPGIRLVIKTSS